jgi:hypothetical protein
LVGLVGANVKITLEIEAEIPGGAPDHAIRTVTENSRTLKFTSQGARWNRGERITFVRQARKGSRCSARCVEGYQCGEYPSHPSVSV